MDFEPGLSFRDTKEKWNEIFERKYLQWLLRRADGNISKAARDADIPALTVEVESASHVLDAPAARLIAQGGERPLLLEEVETGAGELAVGARIG